MSGVRYKTIIKNFIKVTGSVGLRAGGSPSAGESNQRRLQEMERRTEAHVGLIVQAINNFVESHSLFLQDITEETSKEISLQECREGTEALVEVIKFPSRVCINFKKVPTKKLLDELKVLLVGVVAKPDVFNYSALTVDEYWAMTEKAVYGDGNEYLQSISKGLVPQIQILKMYENYCPSLEYYFSDELKEQFKIEYLVSESKRILDLNKGSKSRLDKTDELLKLIKKVDFHLKSVSLRSYLLLVESGFQAEDFRYKSGTNWFLGLLDDYRLNGTGLELIELMYAEKDLFLDKPAQSDALERMALLGIN